MAKTKSAGQHAPKSCGGEFQKMFTEANIPYLECDKCSHQIRDWEKWESLYKDLFLQPEAWSRPADAVAVLLGFFCDLYKKAYGFDYVLSLSPNGLFRGSEATFIRRLLASFGSDPIQVRDYIVWMFNTQVYNRKKKITSLAFLTVQDLISKYRFQQAKAAEISRNTELPAPMLEWVRQNAPTVLKKAQLADFGDLKVLLDHYRSGSLAQDPDMLKLVKQLYYKKIIDQDAKIRNFKEDQ
jgi:Zn ribbon nucleic-acid-binding protein